MASGAYTHTHTHILWQNESDYRKPGARRPVAGAPGLKMYVCWPVLEKDIEESVQLCNECQLNQSNLPLAPLSPWNCPTRPWARIHLDYTEPFQGHYFLVLNDAYPKRD